MSVDFGSLPELQKKLWSAQVWKAGRDESFFLGNKGFVGSGTNDSTKPVHLVTDLTEDERGSRCVMPIVLDSDGDGVVDDNDLEGNEDDLIADEAEIKISQLRNGYKKRGRMSEQKTVIRFRAQAKDKLAFWLADKTDEILFLVASGVALTKKTDGSSRAASSQLSQLAFNSDITAPSSARVMYAGTATSTATLTASDKMTWNLIVKAKAKASRKRIKPVRIMGKPTFVVVMSTEQERDLKMDNDYKTAAAQGSKRGGNNELFTGAFLKIDGLVLMSHNKVYNTLGLSSGSKWGSGGTIDGAQALLLGAQALGYARIGEASWGESDNTDYGNRKGISYGRMFGALKPVFKSRYDSNSAEDFSIISIYTAAAA